MWTNSWNLIHLCLDVFFPPLSSAHQATLTATHKKAKAVIVMRKHLKWNLCQAAWELTSGCRKTSEESGSTRRERQEPAFHKLQSKLDGIKVGTGCRATLRNNERICLGWSTGPLLPPHAPINKWQGLPMKSAAWFWSALLRWSSSKGSRSPK